MGENRDLTTMLLELFPLFSEYSNKVRIYILFNSSIISWRTEESPDKHIYSPLLMNVIIAMFIFCKNGLVNTKMKGWAFSIKIEEIVWRNRRIIQGVGVRNQTCVILRRTQFVLFFLFIFPIKLLHKITTLREKSLPFPRPLSDESGWRAKKGRRRLHYTPPRNHNSNPSS